MGKMICNNSILKSKKPFLFVIKFILLIFISYFIIQLSIEAKEMEEKKNIPDLQTTMGLAKEYMKGKYGEDWEKLKGEFIYPGHLTSYHYLELLSDVGMLWIDSAGVDDYNIQTSMRKDDNSIRIAVNYQNSFLRVVGNNTSFYIEYEDGKYIQNLQMEQETGFTTNEIVKQQEKIRNAFEEEMEKMHKYQIGRVKERRKKFTDFWFIIFMIFLLAYSLLKWISINKRADIEDKYPEEVLKETIAKTKERFLKRRYLLLGCGTSFWIYILKTIVSEFMLSPLEGTAKEYIAYGISAVMTAVIFGLLWKKTVAIKTNRADAGAKVLKNIFQFISGCVVTLVIIQLGIIFVPRFYSPEWRFYKINLLADVIAFVVFSVIAAIKKSRVETDDDKIKVTEKGDFT